MLREVIRTRPALIVALAAVLVGNSREAAAQTLQDSTCAPPPTAEAALGGAMQRLERAAELLGGAPRAHAGILATHDLTLPACAWTRWLDFAPISVHTE